MLVTFLLSPPCQSLDQLSTFPSLKLSPPLTCSWELEVGAENPGEPGPSDHVPGDSYLVPAPSPNYLPGLIHNAAHDFPEGTLETLKKTIQSPVQHASRVGAAPALHSQPRN